MTETGKTASKKGRGLLGRQRGSEAHVNTQSGEARFGS